jgi:hypothetical protein
MPSSGRHAAIPTIGNGNQGFGDKVILEQGQSDLFLTIPNCLYGCGFNEPADSD